MLKEELIKRIVENVLQGRRNKDDEGIEEDYVGEPGVAELVQEALDNGIDTNTILLEALSKGMKQVGEKYETGEYFIPDMLTAAEAVEAGMKVMEPHLASAGESERKGKVIMATVEAGMKVMEPHLASAGESERKGKVIMATVEKDLHDIGKNLVSIMLKGAGFNVVDLGIDVPAARIAEAAEQEKADLVGLSALLNTTMVNMEDVVKELENKGLRDKVKVIIGGAPTSDDFAAEIGADGYGKDAFAAIRVAENLLQSGGKN